MVLVLSFSEYEQCTDPVIDWLLYYNIKFHYCPLKMDKVKN